MKREDMIAQLEDHRQPWDLAIIGGGATGLGIAIDAAARGYKTLLLERRDFAQGTSSRSTKLVHGGVRYLQQGNIPLVMEALKERGILRQNAPHLVRDQPFVVPNYDWWEAPFYGIGMRVYDLLAGRYGFGPSRNLSREETIERLPTIETEGLRGGVVYHDGQFDDARLAINMAETAAEQGAVLLNYMPVTRLMITGDIVTGVVARDAETDTEYEIAARAVINATGPFSDAVRRMEDPEAPALIAPSQGVHLVLPKEFLPGENAIMVPHTDDGRVLFAIPWRGHVVVGTTDTPIDDIPEEPHAFPEEIEFLMGHAARYLSRDPGPEDVRSVFVGIRPLVRAAGAENTAALSRDHSLMISRGGLVSIGGGKWTTYRHMAEDAVDQAATLAGLPERPCVTRNLNIHGYHQHASEFGELAVYGSDAVEIRAIVREDATWAEPIHPALPVTGAEIVWAAREEMARTLEDVLSRRTRALLFNARASMEAAPAAAHILALVLGRDEAWQHAQVEAFRALAEGYMLP
ncbi:MAG: glycerol-3-phosphate dehydrogenase/oxidase [Candidatus Hydrogenedentes bacterium]|nr:glycerol-3-phosphate dehydrogenase/oxidase [Candidatus Hydrogenedentota bacterium]